MKLILPALIALSICCAPASAATPSQGSKVVVPPLITKVASKIAAKPLTVRLPTQAGKVSKAIATNLVAKGPSLIARGDKYYSLCVPNRLMVSCAPIVATSVMKGIEVGAVAGTKGEPLLTFKVDPKMAPARGVYAINYFLARVKKQAAHFDRTTVGATSSLVAGGGGGGGGCTYDDAGEISCTGGGIENGGVDGGGGSCTGSCDYPPGNNGNDDPCIAPDGSRICGSPSEIPQVPVPGDRPEAEEPMSLPTCRPSGPNSFECSNIPPVIGGEPDAIPKGPMPWFPQSWCNAVNSICSAGQIPDNDRGAGSSTSGKTISQLYDICDAIAKVEYDVCAANKAAGADSRISRACRSKVENRRSACYTTARELTDNGSHPAP